MRKIASICPLAIIIFIFGGMFYSIASDVKITINNGLDSPLFLSFILSFLVGIFIFTLAYIKNKSAFNGIRKIWKPYHFLALPAVFFALLSFTIFGAVPKGLHNLTSVNGNVDLTVKEKINTNFKGRCTPRIIVKEVTFSINGHVCISEVEFSKVKVGDIFKVTGLISSYGFERN